MIKYLLTILLGLLLVPESLAGPWPRGKGHGYFQLSFTYLRYHEVINDFTFRNFNLFEIYELKRHINDHTLNGYLEYGITDRLTFVGNAPYKFIGK